MKNWLLAGTAVVALMVSSCGSKDTGENLIKLGVQVLNPGEDSTVVIFKTRSDVERAEDTLFISDTLTFDTANAVYLYQDMPEGFYTVQYGRKRVEVFMLKGKPCNVQFDNEDFDNSVLFTGTLKKYNAYFHDHAKKIQGIRNRQWGMMALNEADFLHELDSTRKSLDTGLVDLMTNKPSFDNRFYRHVGNTNYYLAAELLTMYPRYRAYNMDTVPELSSEYKAELKKIKLENKEALSNRMYTAFLDRWMGVKAGDWSELNPEANEEAYYAYQFELANESFTDQAIRDYVGYAIQDEYVSFYAPHFSDDLNSAFDGLVSNSAMKANIEAKIDEWEPLLTGKPAPKFAYPDSTGQITALDDLRGKLVYVDVWATWCGPCKREIPFLKSLEREFHDQPVQFVSVSVDTDRDAWAQMVGDQQLGGLQLYADGWSEITKDYLIKGIPRFLMIAPDGTILDANAPRPSGGAGDAIREALTPS